jgi:hypothetical protein
MDDAGFVAIIGLLWMVALAIVAGFVVECHFTTASWVVTYVVGALGFAIISVALFFVLTWVDWYLLDSEQKASIARGTITEISRTSNRTIYEVDLPHGASARIARFEFDPQVVRNLRIGVLTGIVLGVVLLLSRGIVRWRRRGRILPVQ